MWIYGKHAVMAALENQKRHVKGLYVTKQNLDIHEAPCVSDRLSRKKITIEVKDVAFFAKTFGDNVVHQGVAADVEPLSHGSLLDAIKAHEHDDASLFVMLDQVTDPHNIGAICRSAAAFNVSGMIHAKHQSAPLDSAILAKTACGGIEHLPQFTVTNFAQTMELFKKNGYWVIGLDERGDVTLDKAPLTGKVVLVLGAEGKGLRRLTKDNCDVLTRLPTNPVFSTVNVSNAAVLSFYEFNRQNQKS